MDPGDLQTSKPLFQLFFSEGFSHLLDNPVFSRAVLLASTMSMIRSIHGKIRHIMTWASAALDNDSVAHREMLRS